MGLKIPKKKVVRYLLYLALVTTIITSATLAKYSTSKDFSAEARVAAFATAQSVDFSMPLEDMVPGSTKTVQFTVINFDGNKGCEVALNYEVQVGTTGNLPLSFSLLGQKESTDNSPESRLAGTLEQKEENLWKAEGGGFPFVSETEGKKTHTYALSVSWPASAEAADYSEEIDMLTVTVVSKQASPETVS